MKRRGAVFRQSLQDFPCTVELGNKVPSWGLSRWNDNTGLRFIPPDDEGFSLRGEKQRLVYKGRRRSHRFTILGDSSFEYDCILLREPESNVISLLMEGAEKFDFFRQPDFVSDQFLKGSYAVYKKETLLVGEGTGKLCHIHRPEIIDAQGRRCWGELSVVGNRLCITIPEVWLSEAKYPVIVDPTIGTTTVGSQYLIEYDPPDDPWTSLMLEGSIAVNRFLVSDTIDGDCTAYFYTNEDDYEAGGRPVLYSDNGNTPQTRRSKDEGFANFRVNGSNPKGWRSATFKSNTTVTSGSYIWFGCFVDFFWFPRFDYGAKCYIDDWYDVGDTIPNVFPMYNVNWYKDFKFSMYFTYTSAQNYVRTLTQGVTLSDSRKLNADYKRSALQTVNGTAVFNSCAIFFRQCLMNATNTVNFERFPCFSRTVSEHAGSTEKLIHKRDITRRCDETAAASEEVKRSQGFFRNIADGLFGTDSILYPVFIIRSISEKQEITDTIKLWGDYIRGLPEIAGTTAETTHEAEYYRHQADVVQAQGSVFRGLLLFIRIVTQVLVRDYLLGRFLKARQELILKSCVSREIILDSKIV